jgi:hypothetical protein
MTIRAAAVATAYIWAVTFGVAIVVSSIPGAASTIRALLAFAMERGSAGSLEDAADYFVSNARVVATILVASRVRSTCRVLDPLVAATVLGNVALVGLAIGAYGTDALPWLIHLPLEWTALGIAAATYAVSSREAVSRAALLSAGCACLILLLPAACLESWATP